MIACDSLFQIMYMRESASFHVGGLCAGMEASSQSSSGRLAKSYNGLQTELVGSLDGPSLFAGV